MHRLVETPLEHRSGSDGWGLEHPPSTCRVASVNDKFRTSDVGRFVGREVGSTRRNIFRRSDSSQRNILSDQAPELGLHLFGHRRSDHLGVDVSRVNIEFTRMPSGAYWMAAV